MRQSMPSAAWRAGPASTRQRAPAVDGQTKRPSQALGEQAQALAVPHSTLIRWPCRRGITKAWPENGSPARWSWTRAASPSKPLRMSVCPVAARRGSRTGRGSSTQQRGDRALQEASRSAPTAAAHGAARQLDLDQARPGRHVGCVVTGAAGRAGRRSVGQRGLLLGQQGAPPSEQQAGVQTVPARHLEAVVAGSSASARMARFCSGDRRGACPQRRREESWS